ncbi:Leucyl aminopeptidase (aminopeptidase T) [Dethiosulfatibacter aminovorans DSM 17477]|uniref:Leucyl aminopeptidase (Aminopeptidase T) n=1 Tax=Dethiosulfatibacter aminovorans DSM 17477 TaxID=1121476 RepID=A0A1M6HQ23_9FIRM|nr:leucyl aminopeptidase [Dethiosulfatibacter aminovorans]SHJ24322.1 Leucyl aminopeptidase (aminopeptidase T) [Dethiosulfatibacter aminovorans DSM 17477]
MENIFQYELNKAAHILVTELALVKPGETVAITADTMSSDTIIDAVAGAVFTAGAKPMVVKVSTPLGVGKAADKDLPVEALGAAIGASDVWIELNHQWVLYSTAHEIAVEKNKNLRHLNLVEMNSDMMVRLIGRVPVQILVNFQTKVFEMTKAATHMRITTESGTDLEFDNDHKCPFYNELGVADHPGSVYLAGQICWFPVNESINGTLVFDGSITPPCGVLSQPVKMKVEKGYVTEITGGPQAEEFSNWLTSFNDPLMYRMAHVCFGLHPNAKLGGNVIEDERIWGATEWGMGYLPAADAPPNGVDAASHTDGISLNSSVWLDGVQILDKGKFVHPDLIEMSKIITG